MIITHAKNIPRALQLLVSVVILFSAAFPLASCSSEDLQPDVDNNQTSADDSTVSSLSLLFVSPGTTRAVSEGTISSVYVILSDKAKSQRSGEELPIGVYARRPGPRDVWQSVFI